MHLCPKTSHSKQSHLRVFEVQKRIKRLEPQRMSVTTPVAGQCITDHETATPQAQERLDAPLVDSKIGA